MVIPVIGVDFGDCTTIMSFIDEYDPVNRMSGVVHNLVPLRFWDGIPNVYYYSRKVGKTLCGQEAISSKAKPEQNRLRNLRRHLGEKIQIDDRIIFYDDAITEVIEHCIRVANKCLEAGWHVSTNLVSLSYPATYTFAQRQRLIELVEKATLEDGRNIKVVGTIADPAAAALDYLAEFANKDIDTTTVLTYDLGGGTFDLGLVSVYPKGRKGRDGNQIYSLNSQNSRQSSENNYLRQQIENIRRQQSVENERVMQQMRAQQERIQQQQRAIQQERVNMSSTIQELDREVRERERLQNEKIVTMREQHARQIDSMNAQFREETEVHKNCYCYK